MLRIIDYPWHQVHLYRLHALPAMFWLAKIREPLWNTKQRPMPSNFQGGIALDDYTPPDFDLALLHLDNWCDARNNIRASCYRIMKQITKDIPQMVIMHGTPDSEQNRRAILQLIGDLPVICNSWDAARTWDGGWDGGESCHLDKYGQRQFRAIIHGYKDEFFNYALHMRRVEVATVCSGGRMSREYHGIPLLERLQRDMALAWYGQGGNRSWLPNYYAYRDMLASTLIYFSPTRRGPMPGARTEAMLSGCCVVTVPGNDIEQYIRNGENGYIVNNYSEARELLYQLQAHPEHAFEVGQAGRATALEFFNSARFIEDWLALLAELGVTV